MVFEIIQEANMIEPNNKIPTCCPNPDCEYHNVENTRNFPEGKRWFRFHGMYMSKQHGEIPRFRCTGCLRTFTPRTGDLNWYLHDDKTDIVDMSLKWLSGYTLSQIAEEYGTTIQKVRTRISRLTPALMNQAMEKGNLTTCCRPSRRMLGSPLWK